MTGECACEADGDLLLFTGDGRGFARGVVDGGDDDMVGVTTVEGMR